MATIPFDKPQFVDPAEKLIKQGRGFRGTISTSTVPTFKAGDLVALSSGVWIKAAADVVANLAMALEPASDGHYKAPTRDFAAPSTKKSDVELAKIKGTYVIMSTGGAAFAAATHIGNNYAIAVDATTGYHYIDLTDTTNVSFKIIDELDPNLAMNAAGGLTQTFRKVFGGEGDTGTRVLAQVIDSAAY